MVDHESTRVLRIVTRLNIGGPSRQVISLTKGLASEGFQSEVATGVSGHREGDMHDQLGPHATVIPSMRREINPMRDLQAFGSLQRIIRQRQPSIVHTHM